MKLVVALDLPTLGDNMGLARTLKDTPAAVKIGLIGFMQGGPDYVRFVLDLGLQVILDMKLHDIPNTMAGAATEACKLGVHGLIVHASAGFEAVRGVCDAVQKSDRKPLVFAVTALTSFDDGACTRVYGADCKDTALRLANEMLTTEIDGLVCSVHESKNLKELFETVRPVTRPIFTLVPGIRPLDPDKINVLNESKKVVVTDKPARKVASDSDMGTNDQKRVGNLNDAKEALADYIVIGRPIYQAADPRAAVAQIIAMMIDRA